MLHIQENFPLAPLTTMRVGGLARYFVEVRSEDEARGALQFAQEKKLPVFILGGGSNIIVSDEGFPGLVMKNEIMGFEIQNRGDKVWLTVGAGENWDEFVRRAVEMGLAGLENLSGVPGTVGSAPIQNVGCYGQSVDRVIQEVKALEVKTGEPRVFTNADCKFSYRSSLFRSQEPGRYFITEVVFELTPSGDTNVSGYQDVRRYFADWRRAPSLTEMRQALLEIRARKGMVILSGCEMYQSVGSFFKNPVVSAEDFLRVRAEVEREKDKSGCGGEWFWVQENGEVKVAAACLLERSGFSKGYQSGAVGISPKHSLAIINLGGAKAAEIVALVQKIQQAVQNKFGVRLEPEAQFVGFSTIT